MLATCEVKLKLFDPTSAPPALTPDVIAFVRPVKDETPAPEQQPDDGCTTQAAAPPPGAPLGRRPIRDRLRAGVVRAVLDRWPGASPLPLTEEQVHEALDEVTRGRPLLDWLAAGGLEKLIELILSVLKLAA